MMKRRWMLIMSALLVMSSAALAGALEQDKTERPRRITLSSSGYLGVETAEVSHETAGRLRLREERGALITTVTSGTAAEKAGLQKDDVIIKWNGEPIESAREFGRRIRETPAGRSVKLGVVRQGSEMEISATLGERADYSGRIRIASVAPRVRYVARPAAISRVRLRDGYRLGISLQGMSPQLAEYFGLQKRNGALVTFVHPDSAAAKAGIKAGDVILSIGGETVENPMRVLEVLSNKGEGAVEVKVMRDRQERTMTVQLEKGKTSLNWSPDDDADGVVTEALVEPFEIGPINIRPLRLAPMVLPQIHIAPMAPVAVPEIRLAPMAVPQIRIAPMAIPQVQVRPRVLPRMVIPRINTPKIVLPPMRLMMPDLVFRIQV